MFCIHQWELLSEVREESMAEKLTGYEAVRVPASFFEGKIIQVFTCKKCGKLKRFVDTI